MNIEFAVPDDAAELLAIYAPYVEETAITFEYEAPTVDEFRERIITITSKYPYIKVLDESGRIIGYAYAHEFKQRKAYDWAVESTIYVKRDLRRAGVGRMLYGRLEELLREMGILNMNACIAVPKSDGDPHLTFDSVNFHHRLGFTDVGMFHDVGYKFRTWYDMVWMEKMLGEHRPDQAEVEFGKYRGRIIRPI